MGFKRQERYVIRRTHEQTRRYVYLNVAGEETEIRTVFGAVWTNSEPAQLTLHQAQILRQDANAELEPWMKAAEPETLWTTVAMADITGWN